MKERREKRKRWVRRGQYAVEVEVEVVYPAGDPSEPCLEPTGARIGTPWRRSSGSLPKCEENLQLSVSMP